MQFFSNRSRSVHLGKFPMEKIRRVDEPTTLIIEDEVKRTPARANGFVRAVHGDFGDKAAKEVNRFFRKAPISEAMFKVTKALKPLQNGEISDEVAPITNDPRVLSDHIKALSYFLDSDLTGICEAKDYCWYSHDRKGNPIKPYHKYAIVLVIDQGFDTMDGASGDDWVSNTQSFRAYMRGAEIADVMADYIRQLGYGAAAHTQLESDVQHVPLSLLAGLGEMSRIGEMIVNPFIGPRLKTTVVTTDLPLEPDKPIDFGLQDFCNKCKKCARECPCGALPFGEKIMYNGYETWKPDAEACTKYRVGNPQGAACGRCMKMCPWNKEGLAHHRLAMWLAVKVPALRRFLVWLDDAAGYGRLNPVHKWWLDLETVDGKVVRPDKVAARGLNLKRRIPKEDRIAVNEPDMWPGPEIRETFKPDRAEGQRRYQQAESPEAARKRTGATET